MLHYHMMSGQDDNEPEENQPDDAQHTMIDQFQFNSLLADPVPPPTSEHPSSSSLPTEIQIGMPWIGEDSGIITSTATGAQQPQHIIHQQFASLNPPITQLPTHMDQAQPQQTLPPIPVQLVQQKSAQPQLNMFAAPIFQQQQNPQPLIAPAHLQQNMSLPAKNISPSQQQQQQQMPQNLVEQQHHISHQAVPVQPQYDQAGLNFFPQQPQQIFTLSSQPQPLTVPPQLQLIHNIPIVNTPAPLTTLSAPQMSQPGSIAISYKGAQSNKRRMHVPTNPTTEEVKSNLTSSASSSAGNLIGLLTPQFTTSLGHTNAAQQANQPQAKRLKAEGVQKCTNTTVVTCGSNSTMQDMNEVEVMKPVERRRYERNTREQQRSKKISQQIKELRNVLTESKVPFKQNKYSILTSVVDYIKQLRNRAGLLDNEHSKLIHTIQQTSDMINSGGNHSSDGSANFVSDAGLIHNAGPASTIGNDAELLCVKGLDYKAIYDQCSIPLGVAALDGRFIMCNSKFEEWTGYSMHDLDSRTLFGLLPSTGVDEVFQALGTLLKETEGASVSGIQRMKTSDGSSGSGAFGGKVSDLTCGRNEISNRNDENDASTIGHTNNVYRGYWSGILPQPNDNIELNISVTRTTDGTPKFFNCALSLIETRFEPKQDDAPLFSIIGGDDFE